MADGARRTDVGDARRSPRERFDGRRAPRSALAETLEVRRGRMATRGGWEARVPDGTRDRCRLSSCAASALERVRARCGVRAAGISASGLGAVERGRRRSDGEAVGMRHVVQMERGVEDALEARHRDHEHECERERALPHDDERQQGKRARREGERQAAPRGCGRTGPLAGTRSALALRRPDRRAGCAQARRAGWQAGRRTTTAAGAAHGRILSSQRWTRPLGRQALWQGPTSSTGPVPAQGANPDIWASASSSGDRQRKPGSGSECSTVLAGRPDVRTSMAVTKIDGVRRRERVHASSGRSHGHDALHMCSVRPGPSSAACTGRSCSGLSHVPRPCNSSASSMSPVSGSLRMPDASCCPPTATIRQFIREQLRFTTVRSAPHRSPARAHPLRALAVLVPAPHGALALPSRAEPLTGRARFGPRSARPSRARPTAARLSSSPRPPRPPSPGSHVTSARLFCIAVMASLQLLSLGAVGAPLTRDDVESARSVRLYASTSAFPSRDAFSASSTSRLAAPPSPSRTLVISASAIPRDPVRALPRIGRSAARPCLDLGDPLLMRR